MSTNNAKRLAAIAAAAALSLPAFAQTTNITVQASVTGTCRVTSVPTLDFGSLNQVTAADLAPAAVNVSYRCTKNTAPSAFTIGLSSTGTFNGSLSNTVDTIAYKLTWTTPTTAGSGLGTGITPVNVPVSGTMLGANYQNVSAGTYTELVPVAITP